MACPMSGRWPTTTPRRARIARAFAGACRRAKIDDFHLHDCRHTWATWHYAENRDLSALQKLGSWKSVRMVLRCAHLNVDELRHAIDRLPWGKLGDGDLKEAESEWASRR
jgi:integrase